jgi:hypothetical protein
MCQIEKIIISYSDIDIMMGRSWQEKLDITS